MKRRQFITRSATYGSLALLTPGRLFSSAGQVSNEWDIKQFQDKALAHYSYAVVAGNKIILVDPERNLQKYLDFAKQRNAKIVGVIETHPHADFTSGHLELHVNHGATIYTSSVSKPAYPSTMLRDGQRITLSNAVKLRAIDTPGHAPEHIAVVLEVGGQDKAVFSGDALLIGDVGRPDLRDYSNDVLSQRKKLAEQMYHTIHQKFNALADNVTVYPAHGAGSLCGKAIKDAPSSTIGAEKASNPAFQQKDKEAFVVALLNDLPFVPKYFPFDVTANLRGLPNLQQSISKIPVLPANFKPKKNAVVIDARPEALFKSAYQTGAINLQREGKFETWLGSVIAPSTKFYISAESQVAIDELLLKTAKIGYEANLLGVYVYNANQNVQLPIFNAAQFNPTTNAYTIVDVRTEKEYKDEPIFAGAINIPLQELENNLALIPADKPVLVTCSSGYRSAAGISLIKKHLPQQQVFDLGKAVNQFKKAAYAH